MSLAIQNIERLIAWANRRELAPPSNPIRRVGIIGAGIMGTSVAAAFAAQDVPVTITDLDPAALQRVPTRIADEIRPADATATEQAVSLVRTTNNLAMFRHCDLVIETIVENLAAKQKLFAELSSHLEPTTLIASNTSAIPLAQLAGVVPPSHPFFGLHFCHPVRQRPLVEIIRGSRLDDSTLAKVVALVHAIKRFPIVVADGPGFVVNRILFPYLSAALELLADGISAAAIEQSAQEFGMPFGPLRMIDEMGADTTLHAGWVLANAFPDRIVPSPLLVTMIKAGRLGQKSGCGFYAYSTDAEDTAAPMLDSQALQLIARWIGPSRTMSPQAISDRLFLPMVLEASRLLEEGICGDVRDIDLAAVFGLGFPKHRGGLLYWADTRGLSDVLATLAAFDRPHLRPTPLLARLANEGSSFYASLNSDY